MAEQIESSALGELLALVAHDLRNPLSALHSNLGFLRSVLDAADPDAREAIDDGLVSCDGLAHIIDNIDLLSGALRDPGRVPEAGSFVDVGAVVEEVVHATRAMAGSHGVELRVERAAGARLSALTAREFLLRAIANLVRSAVQHAPPGSVVVVGAAQVEGRCVVSVVDAGVPLAESVRESAFTAPGQIVTKSLSGGRYSRGLGLFAAALAAAAARATLRSVPLPPGSGSRMELSVASSS